MVDIEHHERDRATILAQVLLLTQEDAAEARTVEASGQRVLLAGLLVFALLDLQGSEVLLEFLLLALVGHAFAAIVEEADDKDDKERDKPDRNEDRDEVDLRNLLALEAEPPNFEGSVTERGVRTRLDFDKRDVREVDARLVDVDFVLGDPPGRHAEFLRDEHGGISLFEREELYFVELERALVALAVEVGVVAAQVEADRSLATGLDPHEDAVVFGEVAALRLAIAQEDLHARIRVGIAFLEFVVDNDGRIRTGKGDRGSTPVRAVRLGNHVGIIRKVQERNIVQTVLVCEQRNDRRSQ